MSSGSEERNAATTPLHQESHESGLKSSPTSPSRIAALTNKLVNLVSSPLRKTADSFSPPSRKTTDNSNMMVVDEEIEVRTRGGSGGLVGASLEGLVSASGDSFFTAHSSHEMLLLKTESCESAHNVSKECILIPPSTSTVVPSQANLLDLEPPCPLTPTSLPKYTERDVSNIKMQQEERLNQHSEFLQSEINALQEKYNSALRTGHELRELLAEYERTMAQIVEIKRDNADSLTTMEQLIQEKQQLAVDLHAMQIAFANLKQRYDESKTINEQLRLHEQGLKANINALQTDLSASDRRYHELRSHAEQKLSEANSELHRIRTMLDAELSATKAKLHKAELKISSLESVVEAKSRENAELMAICDELIQKIDAQGSGGASSNLLASLNMSKS